MRDERLRAAPASLLLLVAIASATLASAAIAIPDLPRPTSFVTDTAGIIPAAVRTQIEALDTELRQKTGAEIAVVTVRTTGEDDIFDYAMAISEAWQPGTKGKDNGVVFLISVDDRKMQILTGYGVEGALPDGLVGEIRDRIVRPAFRAGDFGQGILEATVVMAQRIAADSGVTLTGVPEIRQRRSGRGGARSLFPLILMAAFMIMRMVEMRRYGRGGRRGGHAGSALLLGGLLGHSLGRRHSGYGSFGGGFGGGGGGFGGFGGGGFGGGGAGGGW
ncbi:MAG: TPM domain-containing protein [bacterium]